MKLDSGLLLGVLAAMYVVTVTASFKAYEVGGGGLALLTYIAGMTCAVLFCRYLLRRPGPVVRQTSLEDFEQ